MICSPSSIGIRSLMRTCTVSLSIDRISTSMPGSIASPIPNSGSRSSTVTPSAVASAAAAMALALVEAVERVMLGVELELAVAGLERRVARPVERLQQVLGGLATHPLELLERLEIEPEQVSGRPDAPGLDELLDQADAARRARFQRDRALLRQRPQVILGGIGRGEAESAGDLGAHVAAERAPGAVAEHRSGDQDRRLEGRRRLDRTHA